MGYYARMRGEESDEQAGKARLFHFQCWQGTTAFKGRPRFIRWRLLSLYALGPRGRGRSGMETGLDIRIDDLHGAAVIGLLQEHLRAMERVSPPESRHALDLAGLRRPEITFWSVWDGAELAGCGALKQLDERHAEVKSMRTSEAYLRRGVASLLLRHLIAEARARGYRRLSLETGSMAYFEPARTLYASFGFQPCGPFGSYLLDPNSVFMSRALD